MNQNHRIDGALAIDGRLVQPDNISSIVLIYTAGRILPTAKVILTDTGKHSSDFLIRYGSKINIDYELDPIIGTRASEVFEVTEIEYVEKDIGFQITLIGTKFIEKFYDVISSTYRSITSGLLLKTIFSNYGFNVRLDGFLIEDAQNWIQISESTRDFIRHILHRGGSHNDFPLLIHDMNSRIIVTSANAVASRKSVVHLRRVSEAMVNDNTLPDDPTVDQYYSGYEAVDRFGALGPQGACGVTVTYIDQMGTIRDTEVSNAPSISGIIHPNQIKAGTINSQPGIRNPYNVHPNYVAAHQTYESKLQQFYGTQTHIRVPTSSNLALGDVVLVHAESPGAAIPGDSEVLSGRAMVYGKTIIITPRTPVPVLIGVALNKNIMGASR